VAENEDGVDFASALRAVDRPYACPACGTRYRTPEHAAGCEDDHGRSDVTDEACTEEQLCKACSARIRDLGYDLYDEPEEVRLAVHGTPWPRTGEPS
jgi:hypothetical protein